MDAARFSRDEYLDWELGHAERFEYVDGQIRAMSGGRYAHNVTIGRLSRILNRALPARCAVLGSDQRVAAADGTHTYPDLAVVCGPPQLHRYRGTDTLLNPRLLVEVLSPSTRVYDLGEKLDRYQTIDSLEHVLLVEPEEVDVRHVRRTAEGWETRRFRTREDTIDLMGITVPLAEVYVEIGEG